MKAIATLLVLLGCSGCASPDCSADPWAGQDLGMAHIYPPVPPEPVPLGFGINSWFSHEQVSLGSQVIPGVVVSRAQKLHGAVEAVVPGGGFAPFAVVVMIDGVTQPVLMTGVAQPSEAVTTFELEVDGAGLESGAHELLILATREHFVGTVGIRLSWLIDTATYSIPSTTPSTEVEWDRGSRLQLSDGTLLFEEVSVPRPPEGVFSLVAHVQSRNAGCPGFTQTNRIFALADGRHVLPIGDRQSLEVSSRVERAARVEFDLATAADAGRIDLIQVDAIDRPQFAPDGRQLPWFSPIVTSFGTLRW